MPNLVSRYTLWVVECLVPFWGHCDFSLAAMFFDGSNYDYFYQIILNSDHLFQRSKFFVNAISHAPWWPCYLRDQIPFS